MVNDLAQWVVQLRGWPGLMLAFTAVQAPMLAGLVRGHASWRKLALSPVIAAPLTAVAAAGMAAGGPVMQGLGLAGEGLLQLSLAAGLSAALGYATGLKLARGSSFTDVHRRGTIIADGASALAAVHAASGARRGAGKAFFAGRPCDAGGVTLAGIPVASADETKHFKLIGTTGTGKSTAIQEILGGALARSDRAVIADPDGGYLRRFYDARRGDVILNPFEPNSVRWDLFGEIGNAYDIDQLARSLIPDHGGPDRSWRDYARTFFIAVTRQAHAAGVTDVAELYRLLVMAGTSELRQLVAGTPAQPFLEEHNGRMFDSIRSVTSSAVGTLEYVATQRAEPFSVRRWVAQGSTIAPDDPRHPSRGGGVLFIPYHAGQIAALRSTVSAWMRLAIFEAMNQGEGDQRLWFVVDELDALGQIDGLKDALARLRKFGGRCVLGFQSIAQVSSTYGAGEAQTIVENCGNTLILRCSGSEHGGTSHFASRLIGQREIKRTSVSRTQRMTDWTASTTHAEHFAIEPAIMDSEVEQLEDLEGYVKFASLPQWLRVRLQPQVRQTLASPSSRFVRMSAAPLPRSASMPAPRPAAEASQSTSGIAVSALPAPAVQSRLDAAQAWQRWRSGRDKPACLGDDLPQRMAAAEENPKNSFDGKQPLKTVDEEAVPSGKRVAEQAATDRGSRVKASRRRLRSDKEVRPAAVRGIAPRARDSADRK